MSLVAGTVDTYAVATELRVLGLEPRAHGLKGRCHEPVTADGTTTYENADPALTDLLTYFSEKWPDLCVVIRVWPELPEPIRAGIVAMVKAATGWGAEPDHNRSATAPV